MLSERELQEIEAERRQYEHVRAIVPHALSIVQRHRGWVSDEGIRDIAELLGLSPAEVDSTATFYNLIFRKPVGRHVILVCDSVVCWIMGYEQIKDHLRARLGIDYGETTPDGRFTLLPVVCLGACDQAPAMMVNEELYGHLTPQKIDDILARHE